MSTVGVLVDVEQGDENHYRVSLQQRDGAAFTEVTSALVPRPLPHPDGAGGDVAATLREMLQAEPVDVEELRTFGRHLWNLIFQDPVGATWKSLKPMRTLLDFRPKELRNLPWELMEDGNRIVFTAPGQPFVRAELTAPEQELLDPPLRVLVVVGQPGDEVLRWEDEVTALEVLSAKEPHRLHVEVLEGPDPGKLHAVLKELRPHVFHVIAHGQVVAGAPSLMMTGPTAGPWPLNTDNTINLLHQPIPIVVLNACHTADASAYEGSMGVSEAFREQETIATLSMQGAIRSTSAAAFSAAFYGAILEGQGVDVACAQGRLAIALQSQDGPDRWLPSLVLGVAPGPLLAQVSPASAVPLGAIDRACDRRKLLFALEPIDLTGASRPRGAIVRGDASVGKTWVAQGMGYVFRSRGWRVRYVDLNGTETRRWLDVLRAICGTSISGPTTFDDLPADHFSHFNEAVNEAAEGRPVPAQPSPGVVRDLQKPIGAVSERTLDHIAAIFDLFRSALASAAGDGRLLLILDHLENVNVDDLRTHLVPKLLLPITDDEVHHVHAVLVTRIGAQALDPLRELGVVGRTEDVVVEAPKITEFARFAAVYRDLNVALGRCDDRCRRQFDEYVKATHLETTWRLKKLEALLALAQEDSGG